MLPFYILFFVSGLSLFAHSSRVWIKIPTTLVCVLPILFALFHFGSSSIQQAEMQLRARGTVERGPFADYTLEMFDFIQEQTAAEDTIVFFKPRVMRLMTNRNTLRINNANDLFVADYVCFFIISTHFILTTCRYSNNSNELKLIFQMSIMLSINCIIQFLKWPPKTRQKAKVCFNL